MNKRTLLATLVGGLLLLGLEAPAESQSLEGTTLRVGTWGGSWRDALHELVGKKLEAKGVKVQYVIGNPAENVARLVAAAGREAPLDVLEGSPELLQAMIREGFLQKINAANIPNAKAVPAFGVSEHALATYVTQDGIAYNEQKFKELGLPKPERYSDLINPKLEGHVAFPEIAVTMHWDAAVGLAYDAGGDETTMEKAIEQVKKMKPLYYYPSSTDLAQKFNLGDVWAAPFHAGWVLRIKRTGFPIAHAHPRIGSRQGALWPIYVNIPKGSKNVAGAEAFANLYLDPEVQLEFAKKTGVVPVNPTARQGLMKDPELASLLLLTEEQFKNAFQVDWKKLDPEKWREAWNRSLGR